MVNSATSSFLTESPFTGAVISGSFNEVSNSLQSRIGTLDANVVVNSTTASFVVNSQTGSFVVNSQTGSFVTTTTIIDGGTF